MRYKGHPKHLRKVRDSAMPAAKTVRLVLLQKTSLNILLWETTMTGLLIFNQDRPDIVLETGILYGGLHCGDCFCCLIDSEWIDVRLEYDTDWVLMYQGITIPICYGVQVRV